MITARSLYGLKISGAAWRAKLDLFLMTLGHKSPEADADEWMKRDFNTNGDL